MNSEKKMVKGKIFSDKLGVFRKNPVLFILIIFLVSLFTYFLVSASGGSGDPSIKLKSPFDNKIDLDGNVTFAYNVSDSSASVSNCSLIINGIINQSDTSITEGVMQYFSLSNLVNNDYNWSVNCTNDINDESNSSVYTLKVFIDTTAPVVILNGPVDSFEVSDVNINFNFTVSDDGWITNCSLYTDMNGTWMIEQTNTFVQENTSLYFNVNAPNKVTFKWNIICYDFALNSNFDWGNSNYTLTVNNTAPIYSTIPNQEWSEDTEHTINLTSYFSDVEDNLTYSSTSLNNITVSIDNSTGIVTLVPDINWHGDRTIVFYGFDVLNQNVSSNSVTLTVNSGSDDAPRIDYASPSDNSNDTDGFVFFNCSGFDDYDLVNVSLYTDIGGSWELNQTKNLSGNYDSALFNITNLGDGGFNWNCLVVDNASQSSWGENRSVEVEWSVELEHDITNYFINPVNHNRTIVISYSSYLNNSLTLGDLTIYLSNGSVYFNKNMSISSGFEINSTDPLIMVYAEKFRIRYNETHYGNFTVGNSEWLNITLKYYYGGNNYLISTKQDIEVKGTLPIL